MEPNDRYLVKPVYKALLVLQTLVEAGREITLTELVYLCKMPKSTVYKYLYTLRAFGMVAYDEKSETYSLGTRLIELGELTINRMTIRETARPAMKNLRDQFNETVNLGVMDENHIVYIEMFQSSHSLRMLANIGTQGFLHSTALGKAMMAFTPEQEVLRLLPVPLPALTNQTITQPEKLIKELRDIRDCGYAVDNQENEDGVFCVAAPILDIKGDPVAAVSISMPISRCRKNEEGRYAAGVIQAAKEISARVCGVITGEAGQADAKG